MTLQQVSVDLVSNHVVPKVPSKSLRVQLKFGSVSQEEGLGVGNVGPFALTVEKQVIVIYAATSGYLDSLEVADCLPFEQGLLRFIENSHPSLGKKIADKKQLDDSLKSELNKVLDEFKERFATERKNK